MSRSALDLGRLLTLRFRSRSDGDDPRIGRNGNPTTDRLAFDELP